MEAATIISDDGGVTMAAAAEGALIGDDGDREAVEAQGRWRR